MNTREMNAQSRAVDEALEKGQDLVVSQGQNFIVISAKTMDAMQENTRQMGEMILQLGTMISTMQRRMDDLEARQAQVTMSHGDVKRIQALIRCRADEVCRKYGLEDPESVKAIRAAIKKDVLKRWQVKDLHDLPERARAGVDSLIDGWTSIRLVMERRRMA